MVLCVKKSYISKKDAKKAIRLLRKLNPNDGFSKGKRISYKSQNQQAYKCKICNEWHLTSKK